MLNLDDLPIIIEDENDESSTNMEDKINKSSTNIEINTLQGIYVIYLHINMQ